MCRIHTKTNVFRNKVKQQLQNVCVNLQVQKMTEKVILVERT